MLTCTRAAASAAEIEPAAAADGRHYVRHWLNARHGTGSAWASQPLASPDDATCSDASEGGGYDEPLVTSAPAALGGHAGGPAALPVDADAVTRGAANSLISAEVRLPWKAMQPGWKSQRERWVSTVIEWAGVGGACPNLAEAASELEAAMLSAARWSSRSVRPTAGTYPRWLWLMS